VKPSRVLGIALAEGPRATIDRWRDRAADARRAAAFLEVSRQTLVDRYRARVPVLSLLGVPLRRSSGGVELQFMARLGVAEATQPTACLAPAGGSWRLEATAERRRDVVTLPRGAGESPSQHLARAVETACDILTPRGLHVENSAELDLDVLADAALRRPLLLSLHDLSLFCPRPHLLPVTSDGDCHWTAAAGCALCDLPALAATGAGVADLLARARGLVFPSSFLRDTYRERLAGWTLPPATVVEPAIALSGRLPWRGPGDLRHVAYVGSVQPHKGATMLIEIAPALHAAGLRVSAYGGGDPQLIAALRRAGVRATGYYRAGSLVRRLTSDRVDLVLLLSQWPESHGLTLDECITAGVPALAFDRGALGERLRHGGGIAVDPRRGGDGVMESLAKLRARTIAIEPSREALSTPANALRALDAIYGRLGST